MLDIRWMKHVDMEEVFRIERECFGDPWSEREFLTCLRQRNCIGLVAVEVSRKDPLEESAFYGYMIYDLHKSRLHLLNLAVDPAYRLQGIGRAMIDKVVSKLSPGRRTKILVEVREANTAAHCFFRAMGFRAIKVLRDYYEESPEDAYLFQYRLNVGART